MQLLLIEDDSETAAYVLEAVRAHGHAADHAET
jgi:hypothetical protein